MSGQNTIEKGIAFWAKYNGEKRKGFGKIHRKTKSFMLGKIYRERRHFEAKYNGEKRRGFGKIHTKKNAFWAKYNRAKELHFGQNTMEKSVKVSAKYIQKKTCLGKIQ